MRHYEKLVLFDKGLRPQENSRGDSVYLTEALNVRKVDGAFHSFLGTTILTTPDPVVQINQLKNLIIVITTTSFYELQSNVLDLKLSIASTGRWGIADFGEFILLVDPTRTVSRDPLTGAYALRYDIPEGYDAVNYNGQCLIVGSSGDFV